MVGGVLRTRRQDPHLPTCSHNTTVNASTKNFGRSRRRRWLEDTESPTSPYQKFATSFRFRSHREDIGRGGMQATKFRGVPSCHNWWSSRPEVRASCPNRFAWSASDRSTCSTAIGTRQRGRSVCAPYSL